MAIKINRFQGRSNGLYLLMLIIFGIFAVRLFYLQVLQGGKYRSLAVASQQKKFIIPAKRGNIFIKDGDSKSPIVLNQTKHRVYVDPQFINSAEDVADQLHSIINRSKVDLTNQIKADTSSYLVLSTGLNIDTAQKIIDLGIRGVGVTEYSERFYPEGNLASQVLGFVNSDNEGQYGVEQYYEELIGGEDGLLKTATDANGIPLQASEGNVSIEPVEGEDVTLTIDRNIQDYVQSRLRNTVNKFSAESASAIVLDPNTGKILAMANYPDFSPANYAQTAADGKAENFINDSVTNSYEPGSIMKIFTMATALSQGVVNEETTFFDTNDISVGGERVKNAVDYGDQTRTAEEIISYSLNTGAVFLLEQLGGGTINDQAKASLYEDFTTKYRFGQSSGIEQSNEAAGTIFNPEESSDIRYANMTFGQGLTVTMVQASSAFASLINGGTYYEPFLIEQFGETGLVKKQGRVLNSAIVDIQTSELLQDMLVAVIDESYTKVTDNKDYIFGGKTGTAEIALPNGEYSPDQTIGSFLGFIDNKKGDKYVIMTRVDKPKVSDFAGGATAVPLYADIANWLADYLRIEPKD